MTKTQRDDKLALFLNWCKESKESKDYEKRAADSVLSQASVRGERS